MNKKRYYFTEAELITFLSGEVGDFALQYIKTFKDTNTNSQSFEFSTGNIKEKLNETNS